MTSKQRSNLRSLAHALQPQVIVGKGGVSDNVIREMNDALEAHELIKVQVLPNAECSARDLAEELEKSARAEVVQVMGSKITLYRFSHKKGIEHIVF